MIRTNEELRSLIIKYFNPLERELMTPIGEWDVSKVRDMSYIFQGCKGLADHSLAGWDVSNVTNMKSMFLGCNNFTGESLQNWNIIDVTNMENMFKDCTNFTGGSLVGWNNKLFEVTNMKLMFDGCVNFTGESLQNWNVSNVTNMTGMFKDCSNLLTRYLTNWEVNKNVITTNIFENTDLNFFFNEVDELDRTPSSTEIKGLSMALIITTHGTLNSTMVENNYKMKLYKINEVTCGLAALSTPKTKKHTLKIVKTNYLTYKNKLKKGTVSWGDVANLNKNAKQSTEIIPLFNPTALETSVKDGEPISEIDKPSIISKYPYLDEKLIYYNLSPPNKRILPRFVDKNELPPEIMIPSKRQIKPSLWTKMLTLGIPSNIKSKYTTPEPLTPLKESIHKVRERQPLQIMERHEYVDKEFSFNPRPENREICLVFYDGYTYVINQETIQKKINGLIAKIYTLPEYTTAQKMHIKKLRDDMSNTYLRERVIKRSKLYEFIDSLGVSDLYEYDSSCNSLSNDNRNFSHMENGIKFKEEFKDKVWGKRKRVRKQTRRKKLKIKTMVYRV